MPKRFIVSIQKKYRFDSGPIQSIKSQMLKGVNKFLDFIKNDEKIEKDQLLDRYKDKKAPFLDEMSLRDKRGNLNESLYEVMCEHIRPYY